MKKSFLASITSICLLLTVCLIFSIGAFAQSDVGSITGFVRDPSGAVVPNAKVTITSEATKESHTVTTDAAGHYTVTNLPPGQYTMTAEAPGFKKFESTHNTLAANSTIALDGNLTVGETSETVEVSATAEVLQTESGAVQAEVTGNQIQNQELNGRSPIYTAQFLPGVRSSSTLGDFNGLGPAGQPFNVNGTRAQDTLVTVDGAPALRTRANGAVIGVGDVDATQEIQVLTSDYEAEYGNAAGGQLRFITKSGTTDFHGSLYEYFRNSDLNANTWQRNLSTTTNFTNPFRYNNFGFAVGGPVAVGKWNAWRQKFFFFVAEDWDRYRNVQTQDQAVPTALMRTGNFSELLSSNPWYGAGKGVIYQPASVKSYNNSTGACTPAAGYPACVPFQNNTIPASMQSPNGMAIMNAYPTPTPGFQQGTYNWVGQASQPINQRKEVLNFDILPNDKNHIEIRKSDLAYNEFDPFDQGSGETAKYFNRPNQSNTLDWIYTATPTVVNEARFTFSLDDVYIPVDTSEIGFNRQLLGINYPYLFAGKDIPGKIPTINLNDSFYSLAGGPYPSHSSGPIYVASDSVTKVWGNHTFKFGFLFDYNGENDGDQINVSTVPGGANNQNGNFTFSDNGNGYTSGVSLANLALGHADSYTEIGPRALTIWRRPEYEEFAQDSWKITPKLHIDYGVRFTTIFGYHPLWGNADYFDGALYNPANAVTVNSAGNVVLGTGNPYNGMVIPGFSTFPPAALGRVLAAENNICDGASCQGLFDPNMSKSYIKTFNLLQPRLGIAYQLNEKTVLRAGAGEFATAMPLLDNVFPGGNSPFQPFVTVANASVDNPGASLTTGTAAPITATTLNPNLKQPTAWNWNATFQRELPLNSVVSIAYVAHRGYHAWDVYDINQVPAGILPPGSSQAVENQYRPYKGYAAIQEEESVVNSMYNGLQVSWNRRFSGSYSFGVSYTFSKSMDNSSNYRDIVPDTYNTSNLWGPSEYDVRHMATINWQYNLPFFKAQTDLAGKLLGGWALTGAVQFQTGTPCGIGTNTDYAGVSSNDLGSFGCGTEGQFWVLNGTPQITGGFAGPTGNASSAKYFTANVTAPAAGTFNLQPGVRDSVYGPGLQDWNLMLFKKFAVTERNNLEFRCEAYDFINHPNWTTTSTLWNPTSSQFGEITSKSNLQRTLQLSLRYSF